MNITIELPIHTINQLLIESPAFRDYTIHQYLTGSYNVLDFYRKEIKTLFPDYKTNNIPPIKWVRDETRNNKAVLESFSKAGFGYYENNTGPDKHILDLAASKRFVETID